MIRITKLPLFFPKSALMLVFGFWTVSAFAGLLWQDSAFQPVIRSQFSSGILTANDSYNQREPLQLKAGLQHPFRSFGNFRDGLKDALSIGNPRSALLQYAYGDSAVDFLGELNFVAGYEQRRDDPGAYGFLYKGVRFNSTVNERFKLRALWWNGAFFGDKDAAELSPLIDGYRTRKGDKLRLDNLNADISYRNSWLTAALGRGRFQVGNAISGSLVLSDQVNDYGYFLAEGRVGAWQLSFLHGSLTAAKETPAVRNAEDLIPDKYVALHQVTYQHRDWLTLFGGESVIYGKRGLDLNYLLPHTFWRVTEHNLGDRDNVLIFAGTSVKPARKLTLYLNGILDELTYSKLFTNWWGNKYALQTGAALYLPALSSAGNAPPRLVLEATAVRPWTYTHYTNHTMYSHDGRPLGYAKGSNLVDISAELNLPLKPWLQWNSTLSHTWQGSVGNSWSLDYSDYFTSAEMDSAETRWLEGDLTRVFQLQNTLRLELLAHHSFLLGHSSSLGKADKHQLFGSWQFSF